MNVLATTLVLPGTPPVPVQVFRPEGRTPAGLLVWAHGGSWQHGSATQWRPATAALAAHSGWSVISVDYRLAPRHRHPSAVRDVLTALTWAHEQAQRNPAAEPGRPAAAGRPVAVGGDSAGGTLAACAALAARDRGAAPVAQVLAYPPSSPSAATTRCTTTCGRTRTGCAGTASRYASSARPAPCTGTCCARTAPFSPGSPEPCATSYRPTTDRPTDDRRRKGPAVTPAPLEALARHFADLRDGTHAGHTTRHAKENAFLKAAALLDAPARQVLAEFDRHLLLGTGTVQATGPRTDPAGGTFAAWRLSWPEQRAAGIAPITLTAHYGAGFHHPHLRGATVGEWPLNVADAEQAAELVPVLRTIAAADLHNLVFQRDWRIVPLTLDEFKS